MSHGWIVRPSMHNGHRINLYGVIMTVMDKLHSGGQSRLGHLNLLHRQPEQRLCPSCRLHKVEDEEYF